MRIGVPKEIKDHEFRVGLTPAGAQALSAAGHDVWVERNAGAAVGFSDADYEGAGATVVSGHDEAFACPLVVKVKEPQTSEYDLLQAGQVLFTYLHLAADPVQTRALVDREVVAIAYETVTARDGALPLLTPMSEVAGRLAVQAGAYALQMAQGGRGVLLGGVPGVAAGRVVVLGGGIVGTQAARMAMGLGADVVVLDINLARLRQLDDLYGPAMKTRYADAYALDELLPQADLVVGAVLIAGKQAPKLITRRHVRAMRRGAALVDVAIDQGGCAETSRPTTHSQPIYVEEGVVHYCVTNMPGAVALTSTRALTQATFPYLMRLAEAGWRDALRADPGLLLGLNVCRGKVTNRAVADDLGYEYLAPERALERA